MKSEAKPRFSFVLPAFKGRFLADAIESILAQTLPDFQLVIVNDCSPDDLDSIVRAYDDKRISYHRNDRNIGGEDLVEQWNRCVSLSQGTYVILASDDDYYEPTYLERMADLAGKYPQVDVLYPQVRYVDADGKLMRSSRFNKEHLSYLEFVESYCSFAIAGGIPQYMFKRSALDMLGGFVNFATAWRSDDATLLGMARNGVAVSPEYLFTFRFSGLNISSRVNDYRILRRKLCADRQLLEWVKSNTLHDIDMAIDPSRSTECRERLKAGVMNVLRIICLTEVKACDLHTFCRIKKEYLALEYLSRREYYGWLRQLIVWKIKALGRKILMKKQ